MRIPLIIPPFVILGKLTQKAIENIKATVERDAKAEELIKTAGGEILALYYTFGRYDFVAILELPSPEALAKVLFEICKWGTVSTETMTALTPEQVYKAAKGT
jgi:uncharacterized protein with GYD domain